MGKLVLFVLMAWLSGHFRRTEAHGRMLEPPARNTLWRFGYKSLPNYNDNELFCGGIGAIIRNEGKCGICGDPYDGERHHESGHVMAKNVTTRSFSPGSSVDLMIEIVANHGGWFSFEMCWRDGWNETETEDCFEPLRLTRPRREEAAADERSGENQEEEEDAYKYQLAGSAGTGVFTMSVDLPAERSCENCILRWHWRSGNNWGVCEDGSGERMGCGYQEVFRNCADVAVGRSGAGIGFAMRGHRRR